MAYEAFIIGTVGTTDVTRDPFNESVSDEALAWFVRLRSGDATEEDQRRFEAWRARSPIHAREFDRINALWDDLDGLKTSTDRRGAEGRTANHAFACPLPKTRKRSAWGWGTSLAAALLVLLAGSLWLPEAWVRLASDYHTETGEQKTLTLADGSKVYLDTGSAISVDFSQQTRRLVLHRGRALFVVTADPRRPFEVDAANGTVRALGTVFEVYKKPNQVTVTVLESAVQVSRNGPAARLTPGQRVHYGPDTGLSGVESVDPGQVAAWRRGKLVFNDRPLGEVVNELNRYRHGVILILDQQLRASRVSGIFDIRDPDAVLQALEAALPVRMYRLTRYLILLDRAEVSAPLS